MNFYRCLICGETYMEKDKPSNCPFCGAQEARRVKPSKIICGDRNEYNRRKWQGN